MWTIGVEKDDIYSKMLHECHLIPSGARFSNHLRHRIETFSPFARKEIVDRVMSGASPLSVACLRGKLEMVEYLLRVCHADVEKRTTCRLNGGSSSVEHLATPLWCAALSGNVSVVMNLVEYGADVNAATDLGSTPVAIACLVRNPAVVRFLVENGADINRPNVDGVTCLQYSIMDTELCEFLLEIGADVNAGDIRNHTALHHAARTDRLETAKLLVKYGADHKIISVNGDDALRMAAISCSSQVFEYFTTHLTSPPENLADAYELMGASCLFLHDLSDVALSHWRKSLFIREQHGLFPKKPIKPPIEYYGYQREFENTQELASMSTDANALRIQNLLITERVLGPHNQVTIDRIMRTAGYYADSQEYNASLHLYKRSLEIYVEKDSLLSKTTYYTAQSLIEVLVDCNESSRGQNKDNPEQRFHVSVEVFKLLTKEIFGFARQLGITPVSAEELTLFNNTLKSITHVMYVMVSTTRSRDQKATVFQLVRRLVQMDLRCTMTGDTLLHLCISRGNTVNPVHFSNVDPQVILPTYDLTELLLASGASVNAKNLNRCTPLHYAMRPNNFHPWLAKLLLRYGAHIDQPNALGVRPSTLLTRLTKETLGNTMFNYINLKCFCADVIVRNQIPYRHFLPDSVIDFVQLHEP